MPTIVVTEKHSLLPEEAAARVKANVTSAIQANTTLVKDYSDEWLDDRTMTFSFKMMGFAISGKVSSLPGEVQIETTLPLAATLMKGMIEAKLREEMKKALAGAPS